MRTALLSLIVLLAGCSTSTSTAVIPVPATQTQERHTESGWFCHVEIGEIQWVCEEDTSPPQEEPN